MNFFGGKLFHLAPFVNVCKKRLVKHLWPLYFWGPQVQISWNGQKRSAILLSHKAFKTKPALTQSSYLSQISQIIFVEKKMTIMRSALTPSWAPLLSFSPPPVFSTSTTLLTVLLAEETSESALLSSESAHSQVGNIGRTYKSTFCFVKERIMLSCVRPGSSSGAGSSPKPFIFDDFYKRFWGSVGACRLPLPFLGCLVPIGFTRGT